MAAFRFALLECDDLPLDLQISLFGRLPLPIAAILSSGGRSVHAWVAIHATDAATYAHQVGRMLSALAAFGVDTVNKNPSRLSRLPGAERAIAAAGDGRQRLLYLDSSPSPSPIFS